MNLIVAVSSNWGIGRDNGMLFSLPSDLKYFKQMTLGKTVIMGRKTLDSIPGGKPLRDRTNVVLSRDPDFSREGVLVYHRLPELLDYVDSLPPEEVMVIGGESIYRSFLPLCQVAYITKVYCEVPDADRYCPNLDEDSDWALVSESELHEENGLFFRFCTYHRR